MTTENSESKSSSSWAVYVLAGLLWQGMRKMEWNPQIVRKITANNFIQAANRGALALVNRKSNPTDTPQHSQKDDSTLSIDLGEHKKLSDSLGADMRTVNMDWALGEVKDQKTEGACTAFAISSAVEVILKSRFQIEARIDATRFWMSYQKPYESFAFDVASKETSSLLAEVLSESEHHSFKKGALLRITIGARDIERVPLSKLGYVLSEKKPVIFSSRLDPKTINAEAKMEGFIHASIPPPGDQHAWLMTGVSRGLKQPGDVWFHMRNSWGEDWGQKGNSYLSGFHCVLNDCQFTVIKNISFREVGAPVIINPRNSVVAKHIPSGKLKRATRASFETDIDKDLESEFDLEYGDQLISEMADEDLEGLDQGD